MKLSKEYQSIHNQKPIPCEKLTQGDIVALERSNGEIDIAKIDYFYHAEGVRQEIACRLVGKGKSIRLQPNGTYSENKPTPLDPTLYGSIDDPLGKIDKVYNTGIAGKLFKPVPDDVKETLADLIAS